MTRFGFWLKRIAFALIALMVFWAATLLGPAVTAQNGPTLIAPADGEVVNDSTPTFQWSGNSNPYWLQVSLNDKCESDFVINKQGVNYGTDDEGHCTYTPTTPLEEGTKYYWRVANQCNGNWFWSIIRDFITKVPPYTSGHDPAPGATGVPRTTNIVVHIQDDGIGVKIGTIVMEVEDNPVTPLDIVGDPADYRVTYDPDDFAYEQRVNVEVHASDFFGSAMSVETDPNSSYYFIIETAPGPLPEEKGGGCFIATAAYGTPMAEEIGVLREFRDEYLLTNPVGEALVELYYEISPPIAGWLNDHPGLKPLVRVGLIPIVAVSEMVINPNWRLAVLLVPAAFTALLVLWAVRKRRAKVRGSIG